MHGNAKLPKSLGKKIQKRRKSLKPLISQADLADKIGISVVYMGYIEQGRYAPSLEVLEKIAKTLKIKLSDLF